MYASDIQHYLECGMLTTNGGDIVASAVPDPRDGHYYKVRFVGQPADYRESLISADNFRVFVKVAWTLVEGEICAAMPFESDSYNNVDQCASYMRVDQHGSLNVPYWLAARRNKKDFTREQLEEIESLRREMEREHGYYIADLPRPMPRGLKMSAAYARRKQMKVLR